MKIAITHTRYTRIGGVEGYICDLVAHLLRAGHEVHYFAQWWDKDADSRIHFHKVPNPWKPIRFLKVRGYDRAVTRMVPLEDFDLVHGFSKSSRQDIYTDGSGTLDAYQVYSLGSISPLKRMFKRLSLHQREVAAIERRRFTRGNFRKIIAMSRLAAEQLRGRYGLSPGEIDVIYNGVDLERFRPENREKLGTEFRDRLGIKRDELVLLMVGNDYRRKGVDTAIEAVSLLRADPTFTRPLRLSIVGKERHAREQEMIKKAQQLGVGDIVRFHGPNDRIERFYSVAHLFILPTRFDIFGQVVLEALASGVPPIVSATAGAAECVKDGETGYVLQDPRNARELADKIRKASDDPEKLALLATRARESAKVYSWDRHFEKLLAIYDEVAKAKRADRKPVGAPA